VRCYVQDISGANPRPVTAEGMTDGFPAPDGRSFVVRKTSGGLLVTDVRGGESRSVPGVRPDDVVVRWSADGRSLLLFSETAVPSSIDRVDPMTGRREHVVTLGSADRKGVLRIEAAAISDDEQRVAYSSRRMISHLFLVEGAR
jgi:hypothetical protein